MRWSFYNQIRRKQTISGAPSHHMRAEVALKVSLRPCLDTSPENPSVSAPLYSPSWPQGGFCKLHKAFLLFSLLKAQTLVPISTHRPTQGINANLVEPAVLQVESGLEPWLLPAFQPEIVLQPRLGLTERLELFATARFHTAIRSLRVLALSPKVRFFQQKRWQIALAGWGHLLASKAELSTLADFFISSQGVLTLNASFSTGFRQFPGYFGTAFYTQGIGSRFFSWVEVFVYWPLEYGVGTGLQYLPDRKRLMAMDVALTWRGGNALQLLIGLSRKGSLFRSGRRGNGE